MLFNPQCPMSNAQTKDAFLTRTSINRVYHLLLEGRTFNRSFTIILINFHHNGESDDNTREDGGGRRTEDVVSDEYGHRSRLLL